MPLPQNCVVLMGPPRSGTTILTRVVGAHSRVVPIIEPYHARREEPYTVTNIGQFSADAKRVTAASSLFVKETTSRYENVELSLALLRSAAAEGVRPLVFLILRSPIETFLSQVEMAQTKWKPKPDFNYGERWVKMYVRLTLRGLHQFVLEARRYHRRVILYPRFANKPRDETRRLMAAFPYGFEPSQLELTTRRSQGGDPDAWASTAVSSAKASGRREEVAKFIADFGHMSFGRSLITLHNAVQRWSANPRMSDEEIWDEFERMLRLERVNNRMAIY
jgi:hypothetical protein